MSSGNEKKYAPCDYCYGKKMGRDLFCIILCPSYTFGFRLNKATPPLRP